MPVDNVETIERRTSLDRMLDEGAAPAVGPTKTDPLDTTASLRRHSQLMEWYTQERERQAANRYQMSIDQDYYDNLQWTPEDAQELLDRGQAPLVFNVLATTCDWLIGTEKRTRVDFKVFPRTDDDVVDADTRTQVLKWMGDVTKVGFHRSRAFADAIKVGIGWLEDGVSGDPTQEPIYSRYESWRNMLHDSFSADLFPTDWRYVHRIRHADLDIAQTMFPHRARQLSLASASAELWGPEEDEDFWYLGKHFQALDERGEAMGRRTFLSDVGLVNNRRERVKMIETYYRMPTRSRYFIGGELDGKRLDDANPVMAAAAKRKSSSLYDAVELRVWSAIYTEGHLLQNMPSPYRHNRFPFTPIWCYRRGRDGMPYGVPRRIRDPQDDLNKRASKSLFLLSSNRVTADADSVEDHDEAREEAARPDMYIIKKRGSEFKVENNTELAMGHMELEKRDERMIERAGGVTNENLGLETNAVSGKAIEARQLQGTVTTAEPFSNLRQSIQWQGEIQTSLSQQYITQPKVIRITGSRGKINWLKVNQPEVDAEGNVRFVNDISAAEADFVVGEQDFTQSVRQAMFQSMVDLVGKVAGINPEYALRLLRMALEFSDLPNKDEMAGEVKRMLGITDPGDMEKMTPEEKAQAAQQAKQREAQAALQQAGAQAEVAEKQAKVMKMNAEAEKITADAEKIRAEVGQILPGDAMEAARAEFAQKALAIEQRSAAAVDQVREDLEEARAEVRNRTAEAKTKADAEIQIARIQADGKVREAEIVQQFQGQIDGLVGQVKDLMKQLAETEAKRAADVKEAERKATEERKTHEREQQERDKRQEKDAKQAKDAKDATPPAFNLVLQSGAIQVDSGRKAVGKTVTATTRDGKKVTIRIEPDKADKSDKPSKKE